MLFNLHFTDNTILSCLFFFYLIINLFFLIPALITKILNPIAEMVITIGIPSKETKEEMEPYPVTVEAKIRSAQYKSKLYRLFYASYSVHFELFLQ